MRLDRHDYFLVLAQAAARRATCPRLAVGAVLTQDGDTVATGYNGSLPGEPHCTEVGCLVHDNHCLRTIHAEANAMRHDRRGDTLYCTHQPCYLCMKLIIRGGVQTIYYIDSYKPDVRRDYFLDALVVKPQIIQRTPPQLVLIEARP